jgi:multicomponent Na+:H+ antiporter subunit D
MSSVLPLLVAIPLLTAAAIAGLDHVLPAVAKYALSVAAAGATCGLGVLLTLTTGNREVVHWFGGWTPRGGVAIGIAFAAGPLSAAFTALVGAIVFLALLYSVTYMSEESHLYNSLMLACCGAMCGFALSGDLFNLFVWLELASVSAYALTGFKVKELGPLQGSVNFAIVNTVGSYFVVIGIALTYARTGALNLAQIGDSLMRRPADGLVVVALTMIVCGFLCKAAVVPFHFWLADAYAVAPAPVCAMFAAVLTDIGLLGVARVYWTGFGGALAPQARSFGDLLLWLGLVTALLGGVMAFLQRHLKRMLAYSVISHIGAMLVGIGLLSSKGLAGTATILLAHAFLAGGLFLAGGILFASLRTIDELDLHGRGRDRPWLAVLWFAAALGLAGPPYIGVYLGHAFVDDAAAALGRHWVQPLVWLAGALATAALLRAGARIFLGWGPGEDPLLGPHVEERPTARDVRISLLGWVTGVMVAAGVCTSVVPGLAQRAEHGAARFRDRGAYAARVLHDTPVPRVARLPYAVPATSRESLLYGAGATLLAAALALGGLHRRRLRGRATELAGAALAPPVAALRALHSGVVGDYVLWVTVGTAVIGGIWALTLR